MTTTTHESDFDRHDRSATGPNRVRDALSWWLTGLGQLTPAVDIDGPRVRMGLAWAAVTAVAVATGPVLTAIVFSGVALGAAGQACRSWRRTDHRPYRPVAVGGAAMCALAGGSGPLAVTAAALLVVVSGMAAAQLKVGRVAWDGRVTLAIGLLVGVGAAAPAILRDDLGPVPALVFLGLVHAVDAGNFIVGSGAASRWEGPVAGAAGAGALALAVAATLVPPFRGASPWLLAALVALLAPAGGIMATALLWRADAPVPALRRLDSFLVAGPVWALVAHLVLDL